MLTPFSNSTGKPKDENIEHLVECILATIEDEAAGGQFTPAEAFSAVLTTLYRMLQSMHQFETPADPVHNAQEVQRVLEELLLAYGPVKH